MYSEYKLNKQSDNIQSGRTPFPIWNQSVVPCPVLTELVVDVTGDGRLHSPREKTGSNTVIRQYVIEAIEKPAKFSGGTEEIPIILAWIRGSLHLSDS